MQIILKVIELQHKRPLFDALGACRFPWVEKVRPGLLCPGHEGHYGN